MQNLMYILPRALAIGVLISAPMGPIGMLVIHRTLSKGRIPAFFTGIGAALSDLIYCLLTGLGISFVTDLVEKYQLQLQILGSIVIGAYGLILLRSKPTGRLRGAGMIQPGTCGKDILAGFLLTFSNPLILFFIIGLFARFSFIQVEYHFYHYIAAYVFIFVGAVMWWYFVTMVVDKLRARINVSMLRWINRVIGSVLFIMAAIGIFYAIK